VRAPRRRPDLRERRPVKRDLWATARLVLVGAVLLFALGRVPPQAFKVVMQNRSAQFDYYILALTWSPGFCATHSDPIQCTGEEGFVLHGLWPEFEGEGYPASCRSEPLPEAVRRRYADLYPTPRLIDHQWAKHGTCSGLEPEAYFQLTDRIRRKVVIPAAYAFPRPVAATQLDNVRKAFRQANPAMPADGIRAKASDHQLGEVRICVTREGDFRSCT